jgi:hypothetical protein
MMVYASEFIVGMELVYVECNRLVVHLHLCKGKGKGKVGPVL